MAREKFQTLTEQMFYVLLSLRDECCGADIMARIANITHGRVTVGPERFTICWRAFRKPAGSWKQKRRAASGAISLPLPESRHWQTSTGGCKRCPRITAAIWDGEERSKHEPVRPKKSGAKSIFTLIMTMRASSAI